MFIVVLKFSDNKGQTPDFMQGHKDWLKQGFDDGLFLVVGSLKPNMGGSIIVHNTSLEALQQRVNEDPFVVEKIVSAEILEVAVNQADERFNFLLD